MKKVYLFVFALILVGFSSASAGENKSFTGYIQVDDNWKDVRILRNVAFSPDGTKMRVVERVETMLVEWVRSDMGRWIFRSVVENGVWFDQIVVEKDKTVWAEKIGDGGDKIFRFEATRVTEGVDKCYNYRCGAIYQVEAIPSSCKWNGPGGGCTISEDDKKSLVK